MFPLAMERDEARPHSDAIKFSLEIVDEAEVYLGIFGFRYGYIPDEPRNPHRLSVTELEFRRAQESGIPMLLFVMSHKHPIMASHMDTDPEKWRNSKPSKRIL